MPTGHVLFCTAGGVTIGLGHVRRCLALAAALRQQGACSTFIVDGDPAVGAQVATAGFTVARVTEGPQPLQTLDESRAAAARVVVVDSYRWSSAELETLAAGPARVAVIDDMADRALRVDLVINGAVAAPRLRYEARADTRFLLGPSYALLRSDFAAPPPRTTRQRVERLLVTVGGSDPRGLTPQVIRWAQAALPGVQIDAVVGPLDDAGACAALERAVGPQGLRVHRNPPDMRGLMLAADLALCGGGQTALELAATATPALAVRVADNQTENLRGLSDAGALHWVGDVADGDLAARVRNAMLEFAGAPGRRTELGMRGRALVDGRGAERVAAAILELAAEGEA